MASQALNGLNGHHDDGKRWSYIPPAIDIPLGEGEEVEVNLSELLEDPTELCTLLENEGVAKGYWEITAMAYAKENKMDHAIDILKKGLSAFASNQQDRLSIFSALCWMCLYNCRHAPRIPEGSDLIQQSAFYVSSAQTEDTRGLPEKLQTKDYWLAQAAAHLNSAARISPSYPPIFLARGVYNLLKSSLVHPDERHAQLTEALKAFDNTLRASNGKNIFALIGRARVLYSMSKWADAHQCFQEVLRRAPEMIDPDPRIGMGCCLWQLGHHEDAKNAWERALELNSESKQALLLLGQYYFSASSKMNINDPKFETTYTKAVREYAQYAVKLDKFYPLALASLAPYMLTKKPEAVARMGRNIIERADVSTVASEGWFQLARLAHSQGENTRAFEYYAKADQARGGDGRGGDDQGHLPSKFGMAQIKVLQEDYVDAKFRLEKLHNLSRSTETMSLLGVLYADDYFSAPETNANAKDDERLQAWKKAISFLEGVRATWKDAKKNATTNADVLLTLARLYEIDAPDKSLQCLQQAEEEELRKIPELRQARSELEQMPLEVTGETDKSVMANKKSAFLAAKETAAKEVESLRLSLRDRLSPAALNNMGCLHFQADRYGAARDYFQTALNACVRIASEDSDDDTDALVSTISYNLARCYEAEGMNDEAKKVYEGLLERHAGYIDASARLAYIALRENPRGEGAKAMSNVFHSAEDNLDIRGLYGWYLNKTRKPARNATFAEDNEQRHLKHTLRDFNKHDHYSLTAMGNLHLIYAREMPRQSESDRQKRKKMYEKAVEFFTKALELDSRNAYAVQGLAIALVEDKKDMSQGIQLLSQVREVLKDPSVYINLGHAFCELKQYSRAVENYESALVKDRINDVNTLVCLGRTWLLRAKQERSLQGMKTSLDYSQRALDLEPEIVHFKFNLAYVRIQIAQLIYTLKTHERSADDVQTALEGLDAAVDALTEIAKSPNPPFPRADIEQRAVMCRTSVHKQLERALGEQREYEKKNADRLAQAKGVREAEIRKREEEERAKEEREAAEKVRILNERLEMQRRDREIAEKRAAEERLREEEQMTTDDETGERKKRVKKKGGGKRKKRDADSDSEDGIAGGYGSERGGSRGRSAGVTGDESEGAPKQKKKRKLERKNQKAEKEKSSKFKSAEFVQESDEEEEGGVAPAANGGVNGGAVLTPGGRDGLSEGEEEIARPRKKKVIDDEDEDEDEDESGDVEMAEAAHVEGEDEE
ncbi:hypothetical protein EG328_009368 [Venturia inaequalis]|uniref:TPR-like protein n=1 Tax=Venturia inaequalis TaxID=5025 RepID=A0A8H3Z3H8_VENIN|nr:hypothetical protein EG328_009368 [Venturia inaequalis]RDI77066.1 hypothetical protein Vi05172_g12918 [Venturia inaequalis]